MINYNRPKNIRFKGIIGMNNVISSVNYFSGGGYLYFRIILQNSIHCLSQYLNVPLNKFSENDVILKTISEVVLYMRVIFPSSLEVPFRLTELRAVL